MTADGSLLSPGTSTVAVATTTTGFAWDTLTPNVDPSTGQIGISLSNAFPVTSTVGGSLVLITFHIKANDPSSAVTPINLVPSNTPNGASPAVQTRLDSLGGQIPVRPPVTTANNDPHVDGIVTISGASQFVVTAPSTATAGSAFNFTVVALDGNSNTATNYVGTVHFTSSDGEAMPIDATLTNGVGTFSATLKIAGSPTITATDTVVTSITGSTTIAVVAAAPTHFSVTGTPTSVTAGNNVSFTVKALDAYNNTTTSYLGIVSLVSSDTQATGLPPTSTLTSGVGSFTVKLKTAGLQTVTASDALTSTITGPTTSNTITVIAAPATHLAVSGSPSSVTAGTFVNFTVAALDPFGNTDTGYGGSVTFRNQ